MRHVRALALAALRMKADARFSAESSLARRARWTPRSPLVAHCRSSSERAPIRNNGS
jgi:hypothetical protein